MRRADQVAMITRKGFVYMDEELLEILRCRWYMAAVKTDG